MWVFLATEMLLFGGLFATYTVYRTVFPHEFAAARGQMSILIGTINTYVLVIGSIVVAFATRAARHHQARVSAALLFVAALLGVAFLGLKGVEYAQHYREGALPGVWYANRELQSSGANIFFTLYFLMTG